jgi:lipopolysaccharide transport system permease protein
MVVVRKKRQRPQDARGIPVIRVKATQGWGSLRLDELWRYQDLIYFMLWKEIKGRYAQMALGPLWLLIQPVFAIGLNTLVFGVVAKLPSDGLPYPLFNYAAVLPWMFFSGALTRSAGSLVNNQHLIAKVYFPRLVMPIVGTLSGIFDFVVSFGLLLVMMLGYRVMPSFACITVPLFLLLGAMTALGVGLWLSALQARFRDVGFMLTYILQAWMYATPVVYASSIVPERWQFLYRLNPMTTVVEGFRWALLGVDTIRWVPAALSAVVVLALLVSGAYVFRRTERTIVDIV